MCPGPTSGKVSEDRLLYIIFLTCRDVCVVSEEVMNGQTSQRGGDVLVRLVLPEVSEEGRHPLRCPQCWISDWSSPYQRSN